MKKSKGLESNIFYFILFLAFAVLCGIGFSNSYFTAIGSTAGDVSFHNLKLEVNTPNEENSLFSTNLTTLLPGDTIEFTEVEVKNSGTADVYSLVNLNIVVSKTGQTDYVVNHWYNLSGGGGTDNQHALQHN